MTPVIGASVTLATDRRVDLSVVEARTGLPTHRTLQADDPRVSPSGHTWPNPAPRSFWTHRGPYRETFDLEAVVVDMLDVVEPVRDEFVSIIEDLHLDGWLSVVVKMPDEPPAGTLTAAVLGRLTALRLDLDLDLYLEGS